MLTWSIKEVGRGGRERIWAYNWRHMPQGEAGGEGGVRVLEYFGGGEEGRTWGGGGRMQCTHLAG